MDWNRFDEANKNDVPLSFSAIEYSYDLLTHPEFTINKRPNYMMPKPFVVTDAIAIKLTIDVNSLNRKVEDSIFQKRTQDGWFPALIQHLAGHSILEIRKVHWQC